MKLTRQGVRDLNYVGPKIPEAVTVVDPVERRAVCANVISTHTLSDCFGVHIDSGYHWYRVDDRHLWARGWDTEKAKALHVAEALK